MSFDANRKRRAYNAKHNKSKKARRIRERDTAAAVAAANNQAYGIRAPSGRRTKLDKPTYDSICKNLAEGQTVEVSCTLSGIEPATLYSWIKLGQEEPDGPFGQFVADIQYAKEVSHRFLVSKIAYDEDWRAAAWLLKNRFPRLYRDHISQEIAGPDGGPVPIALQTFNVVLELHPAEEKKDEQQREFRIDTSGAAAAEQAGNGTGQPNGTSNGNGAGIR